MLEVILYDDQGVPSEPIETTYVSLVSPETWGVPPLVAPKSGSTRARVGETVLYVPTGPGARPFSIKRVADYAPPGD